MTRSEDIKKEHERVRREVSKAIKSAMKAQRVSVYQLAKDSEVSHTSVLAILKGDANPRFDTIVKICTSLGVKIMII